MTCDSNLILDNQRIEITEITNGKKKYGEIFIMLIIKLVNKQF